MSARSDALKAEISRRAAEFDPASLVVLLTYLGYRSEEILFQSATREVSQPSLVHRVEFRTDPVKQAIVRKFSSLNPNQFSTAGVGWDRPADPSDPNNNAKNRRVEIKVYPLEQK